MTIPLFPPKKALAQPAPWSSDAALLFGVFLLTVRRVGVTGTTRETVAEQLFSALGEFVSVSSSGGSLADVWVALAAITCVLCGWTPVTPPPSAAAAAEWSRVLALFGIPLLVAHDETPSLQGTLVCVAVCLPALRSPPLILLPTPPTADEEWQPSALRSALHTSTLKLDLKQCTTREQVEDIAWRKQREVDVLAARLSKLDHSMKREKLWLQKQLRTLEREISHAPSVQRLQSELDTATEELQALRQQQSLDRTAMAALQQQLRDVQRETHEMETSFGHELHDKAIAEVAKERVRTLGGQWWGYLPWVSLLFTIVPNGGAREEPAILDSLLQGCITGLGFLSRANGHLADVGFPTLADMMDLAPESCFGALFTAVEATMIFFMALLRWRLNADQLDVYNLNALESSRFFHRVNHVALIFALIAFVGLVGLGTFQYHNLPAANVAFVSTFFVAISLYLTLLLLVDVRAGSASVAMRVFRLVLLLLQVATTVAFVILRYVGRGTFDVPEGVVQLVAVALLNVHLLTFASELTAVEVVFDVRKLSRIEAAKVLSEETPLRFDFD